MINDDDIEFKATGFDYVNPAAQIVLVGITPGNTQLLGSRCGKTPREIKRENAFAGGMRNNLFRMLDHIGVNTLLGISSCKSLWEEDFDKVEMTSLLRDATFSSRLSCLSTESRNCALSTPSRTSIQRRVNESMWSILSPSLIISRLSLS